jgi:hypothetical protein
MLLFGIDLIALTSRSDLPEHEGEREADVPRGARE